MTPIDVEQLLEIADKTAEVLGFTIGAPCRGHLRGAVQQTTLDALPVAKGEPPRPYPPDTDTRLLLAKARVAQFTAAMVADALHTGPPPDMMLHENNFFAVRDWICPLWPVCK